MDPLSPFPDFGRRVTDAGCVAPPWLETGFGTLLHEELVGRRMEALGNDREPLNGSAPPRREAAGSDE